MAAPTPTSALYESGKAFVATWHAVWANTDDLTDSIVVNLSSLKYTNRIIVKKMHITATAGISALIEWDDDTTAPHPFIYRHPIGVVGNIVLDFSDIGGLIYDGQASSTNPIGDIIITTSSAASADEISIVVIGRSS